MSTFRTENRDGVLVVGIDQPGGRVNTITNEMSSELGELLERIERDGAVQAAVLISRKAGNFIAGADVSVFETFSDRDAVMEVVGRGQALFDRLERLAKPVVAAVDGSCMGGGLELALACSYRIAATSPKTKFALPEVQLGLLPAFGGCQRLPRLVGLAKGLELILTGRNVYPKPARTMGLVDATIHPAGLEDAAVRAARGLADGSLEPRGRERGLLRRALEDTPLNRVVYDRARDDVRKRTRGNYPAPPRIIETIRTGMESGVEAGLAAERRHFAELVFTSESRALVHLFFARNATAKNPYAEADGGERPPVRTVGVLGAGLMGAGIAQVSAGNGYRVVLKDVDLQRAAHGKGTVYRGVSRRVGRGVRAFERDRIVARVRPTDSYEPFADVDLTVEAVLEKLELKRAVLADVEARAPEHHVFATNTSSIPIADIAAEAARPEAVLGMHYFSPVPKMPLLEVIATERTADWALGRAVAVGLRQGKNVIVVADRPGFYANRILAPYIDEALKLLHEGATVDDVDGAMRAFGFPVGPLQLLDEVGIDVGVKVTQVMAPLFAERGRELTTTGERILESGVTGRKGGRGFYRYDGRERKGVDETIYRFFGSERGERRRVPQQHVQQRLFLAMVNEAVATLEEDVIRGPTDGDVGAVFGIGFPPFLGGPFHWLDRVGAAEAVDRLERLEAEHGARFAPVALLREKAERGERFG